jgi:hypothetical protein
MTTFDKYAWKCQVREMANTTLGVNNMFYICFTDSLVQLCQVPEMASVETTSVEMASNENTRKSLVIEMASNGNLQ